MIPNLTGICRPAPVWYYVLGSMRRSAVVLQHLLHRERYVPVRGCEDLLRRLELRHCVTEVLVVFERELGEHFYRELFSEISE